MVHYRWIVRNSKSPLQYVTYLPVITFLTPLEVFDVLHHSPLQRATFPLASPSPSSPPHPKVIIDLTSDDDELESTEV